MKGLVRKKATMMGRTKEWKILGKLSQIEKLGLECPHLGHFFFFPLSLNLPSTEQQHCVLLTVARSLCTRTHPLRESNPNREVVDQVVCCEFGWLAITGVRKIQSHDHMMRSFWR